MLDVIHLFCHRNQLDSAILETFRDVREEKAKRKKWCEVCNFSHNCYFQFEPGKINLDSFQKNSDNSILRRTENGISFSF